MVLPGEVAKESRKAFVSIISRFINGDDSMHAELDQNKAQGVQKNCELLFKSIADNAKKPSLHTKYIYASYSEAFKGQVKIGRAKDVKARISSGNTMCAPNPHKIIAVAPTLNYKRDEAMAHDYFASYRTSGEFFAISHADVKSFLADKITSVYHQELKALMHDISESEDDDSEMHEFVRKELVEEKNKVGVLTRQVGDFQKCIGELREAVEDNTAGQIEINANQDDIKESMEEIKGNYPKILLCFDEILGSHDHTNDNYKKMDARLQEMDARQKEMDARQKEMDARQKKILSLLEAMMRSGA